MPSSDSTLLLSSGNEDAASCHSDLEIERRSNVKDFKRNNANICPDASGSSSKKDPASPHSIDNSVKSLLDFFGVPASGQGSLTIEDPEDQTCFLPKFPIHLCCTAEGPLSGPSAMISFKYMWFCQFGTLFYLFIHFGRGGSMYKNEKKHEKDSFSYYYYFYYKCYVCDVWNQFSRGIFWGCHACICMNTYAYYQTHALTYHLLTLPLFFSLLTSVSSNRIRVLPQLRSVLSICHESVPCLDGTSGWGELL